MQRPLHLAHTTPNKREESLMGSWTYSRGCKPQLKVMSDVMTLCLPYKYKKKHFTMFEAKAQPGLSWGGGRPQNTMVHLPFLHILDKICTYNRQYKLPKFRQATGLRVLFSNVLVKTGLIKSFQKRYQQLQLCALTFNFQLGFLDWSTVFLNNALIPW